MATMELRDEPLIIDVENIGGITSNSTELPPGVSILSGENATNRTSFLQALMAGFGSKNASLKADADSGSVTLQIGDETYSRTLTRKGKNTVAFEGEPYIQDSDDVELAELYAFLLEENEVRRTVANDGDLHDVLMRPIDTAELEREISDLETEKANLDRSIEDLRQKQNELDDLEIKEAELENQIEELREEKDQAEKELEELEEQRQEQAESELQSLLAKKDEIETRRSDVESEIQRAKRNIEQSERELENLDIPDVDPAEIDAEIDDIEEQLSELREEQNRLRSIQNAVSDMVSANQQLQTQNEGIENILATLSIEPTDLSDGPLKESVEEAETTTDALVEGDTTVCHACGQPTTEDQLQQLGNQLREIKQPVESELKNIRQQIDNLGEEKSDLSNKKSQYAQKANREEQLEANLEDNQNKLQDLKEELEELEADIESVEEEIDSLDQTDEDEEYTEARTRVQNLSSSLSEAEGELKSIRRQKEDIKSETEDLTAKKDRREEVKDRLDELRDKTETIEQELVSEFNDEMGTVLDLLDYRNIERIWIESQTKEVREGRQKTERTVFDLHIVRSRDDGSTYEDTIDNLSESEREVAGLVVALTGYLVHDVYEVLPIMLFDSIEMIDSERIRELIEHFAENTEYLVAALLPEDAAAFEGKKEVETIEFTAE